MQSEIKKKIIYFSGLGLTFVVLLFIAGKLELSDSLHDFMDSYGTYFLIICILFLTLLIHDLLIDITNYLKISLDKKLSIRELEGKLMKLSSYEKYILSLFVTDRRMERTLDPNEPAVAQLESLKTIFKTGKFVDGKKQVYQIDPLSMKILSSNPNWLQ